MFAVPDVRAAVRRTAVRPAGSGMSATRTAMRQAVVHVAARSAGVATMMLANAGSAVMFVTVVVLAPFALVLAMIGQPTSGPRISAFAWPGMPGVHRRAVVFAAMMTFAAMARAVMGKRRRTMMAVAVMPFCVVRAVMTAVIIVVIVAPAVLVPITLVTITMR